jgi:hypothetical protein
MELNNFSNPVYIDLEMRIKKYLEDEEEDVEKIVRDIREASLYGKIESYEEIHLMDLLDFEQAENIDDGYVKQIDKTTGGLQVEFEEEEKHDMSYLDDYEEEEEEKDEGFLSFLK